MPNRTVYIQKDIWEKLKDQPISDTINKALSDYYELYLDPPPKKTKPREGAPKPAKKDVIEKCPGHDMRMDCGRPGCKYS